MKKVVVEVDGMMCGMCEAHVNDLFRRALNPKRVKSSARKKTTVLLLEEPIDEEKIRSALDGSGYRVLNISF